MFEGVERLSWQELPRRLEELLRPLALQSVVVLDLEKKIVAGGSYTKPRPGGDQARDEAAAFRALIEEQVIPELAPGPVAIRERRHLHTSDDARPSMFALSLRFVGGRMVHTVVEIDLGYLVTSVFARLVDVRSNYLDEIFD